METLLTVLITLGVCTIVYTFVRVIKLNRKVEEIDIIKLDLCDFEDKIYNMIENLERDSRKNDDDILAKVVELKDKTKQE